MSSLMVGGGPAPLRIKAVFHCFLDDGGKETAPNNGIVVIAGYLAVDEVWARFGRLWGHLLIKHDLPDVHMRSIFGIAKAKGWDDAKLNSVLQEFVVTIRAAPGLIGFGIGVDADEWRKFSEKQRFLFGDAQEFACTRIARRIRDRLNGAGLQSEHIALVFDQHFELARRRLTAFEHISGLAQLAFTDARLYYPLQAADLLAWETSRQLTNRIVDGKSPTAGWKASMAVLPTREWDFTGEYWDKEMIERHLPELETASSASAVASSEQQPSSTCDQRQLLSYRPALRGLTGRIK